ncbi:uncharacterized protein OCT59_026780 [Rhizophagus irregularis]|uniref:Uncharacterized protein n=2 Tax=Rhizophagus irregularis TaxID=588596 RepID=A0A015JY77_RHIIW|nr:hypothetical protein RirG_256110 [Rhizophagus irregularis DAOM 197198w]UZO06459.1 hypothetical protein OCT59_026780 [Rhizophagus irregularis]GBC16323.1 kinase-like domain-containing protein [Rhizophagus irregularis DAOM 181602=DAOM 197198]
MNTSERELIIAKEQINNPNEIYNWLSNNQTTAESIFLLGYFNYYGIGTIKDEERAFKSVSEENQILA